MFVNFFEFFFLNADKHKLLIPFILLKYKSSCTRFSWSFIIMSNLKNRNFFSINICIINNFNTVQKILFFKILHIQITRLKKNEYYFTNRVVYLKI